MPPTGSGFTSFPLLFRAFLFGCALIVGSMGLLPGASAQADDDPPWLVGRVAYLSGPVQILQASDEQAQWREAQVNDVVTTGTVLSTAGGARVEVRIGHAALRLGGVSELSFPQLDGDGVRAQIDRGTVTVRVWEVEEPLSMQIMTPNALVDASAPGRYRVDASAASRMALTVLEGRASVLQGENRLVVEAGKALTVAGIPPDFHYDRAAPTALDDWSLARDQANRAPQATRYVSPYMTGHEDLDLHGDWHVDATYGTVWVPRTVPAGWVPYRHGRWTWVRPWGWTWVDDAPWGFAPFHYGRWVYTGHHWAWWPGGYVARPVYAPALVSFVAGGPRWSVSVHLGTPAPYVGWYPLAPWERYHPIYVRHPRHVRDVNRIVAPAPIIRDKQHHGADRHVSAGLTAVSSEVLTRTLPVARHASPEARQELRAPRHAVPADTANALPRPLHYVRSGVPAASLPARPLHGDRALAPPGALTPPAPALPREPMEAPPIARPEGRVTLPAPVISRPPPRVDTNIPIAPPHGAGLPRATPPAGPRLHTPAMAPQPFHRPLPSVPNAGHAARPLHAAPPSAVNGGRPPKVQQAPPPGAPAGRVIAPPAGTPHRANAR